jgi:hypothetical protein
VIREADDESSAVYVPEDRAKEGAMRKFNLAALCGMCLVVAVPSVAAEARNDQTNKAIHHELTGVVSKIRSGMVFVSTPTGLRPRTISPIKADRVGLHDPKVGESVVLMVDTGNVLLDVHRAGRPFTEHRMLMGALQYSDPYWGEIKLSTPDGIERYEVDALAGSKLSVFQAGTPVIVELDGDNVMIDIHRSR